jgi:hypothetical protein
MKKAFLLGFLLLPALILTIDNGEWSKIEQDIWVGPGVKAIDFGFIYQIYSVDYVKYFLDRKYEMIILNSSTQVLSCRLL